MKKITINNQIISIKDDYISLTDIAKYDENDTTDHMIQNWMRSRETMEFLGIWERLHNPNFKPLEFEGFKSKSGLNRFSITPKKWTDSVNAIGIYSSSGRYGGTFAHKDIAFEFAMWISPEFKLCLIMEFQRLKDEESLNKRLEWNISRYLTKINYKIHTESIKQNIIIPNKISLKNSSIVYANEADVLNMALFGKTAKDWRDKNPEKEGNIRDYAKMTQLICLSNLEVLNSQFIKEGLSQKDRLIKLNEIAISQMKLLIDSPNVKNLLKYPNPA